MSQNFDREIALLEEEQQRVLAHMERVKQDFLDEAATFLSEWYWQQTETQVTRNHDVTQKIGIDKLRELKQEVKALQSKAGEIINEYLNDDRLWWHIHKEGDPSVYIYAGRHVPDNIATAMRLAAGKLGPVLVQYYYLPADPYHNEAWIEWDSTGNRKKSNGRPYYPYGLMFPISIEDLGKKYKELLKSLYDNAQALKNAEAERDIDLAKSLWNKA